MWFRFRRRVVQAFFWFTMRCQVYNVWSHIYRFLFERKRAPLPSFGFLADLVVFVRGLKWRPDTWRQLWDAVSHPNHVMWLALNDPGKLVGDCDDFFAFNAEVLATQFRLQPWRDRVMTDFQMLTVQWWKSEGGFGGHNVCLITDSEGKFAWMDYDFPSAWFDSLDAVVDNIMSRYAADGICNGYAVSSRGLFCKKVELRP